VKYFAPAAVAPGPTGMRVAASEAPAWSEAEWLRRCRAGDRIAWRRLYDQHFPQIYRLALRLGVTEREAADVCQEVFLRVYRGLARFRGEAQIGTWIYRIAVNEVTRMGRAGALRRAFFTLLGRGEDPRAPATPEQTCQQTEALRELHLLLARMKPKQRAVFVLFELEELCLEEIAEVVGAGLETVKSRLRHARADFERMRRQRNLVALAGGRP
jgi:RNA polymerase sigma-70 factor (ECF subfamily)